MGSAIERADRMRFRNRICSLDCASHWYHCKLTAELNFKSFITFLISANGTYYFTSKLFASSPLELYKKISASWSYFFNQKLFLSCCSFSRINLHRCCLHPCCHQAHHLKSYKSRVENSWCLLFAVNEHHLHILKNMPESITDRRGFPQQNGLSWFALPNKNSLQIWNLKLLTLLK